MNKETYTFTTDTNLWIFKFESQGPNGIIKKMVRYSLQGNDNLVFFNLGFGDIDLETGELNDKSISNNNDKDKILATVAATVLDFTSYFPKSFVYAEGSNMVRTRLYQMAISSNLEEISSMLFIYGLHNGVWAHFERGVNYQAFMALRRN